MSIIVPSSHTGIEAWVNSKMYTSIILYNIINCHARVSHRHRIHGKLGLQLSLLRYIYNRIRWVSLKGIFRYRCRRNPGKLYKTFCYERSTPA